MDSKYAITEIITSGLNFKLDRIIHISSFVVEQNEIKGHITTYINPERTLDPDYIRSTGILNDNIKFSPKFYEKAKLLIELWEGCKMVSSNPRITLTFLKKEFKSLGFDFKNNIAPLRDVITEDLPKVVATEERARLYTSHFLEYGIHKSLKKDFTPRAFLEKEIKLLPNECGIYMLKNENGTIIYVGKAIKIRTRLRQHFRNLNNKGFKIHRMVAAIDYKITGTELFALLVEQHHILKYKPELNKALRNNIQSYGLRYQPDNDSSEVLRISPLKKSDKGHLIKRFKSRKSALSFIVRLIKTHDLELTHISFFGVSLNRIQELINTLDIDEEEIEKSELLSVNEVVEMINPFYKGKYIIQEKGHDKSYALLENGEFLGLSLNGISAEPFEDLKENLEYPYQSEYALNQIIRYLEDGLLKITRH